MTIEEKAKAYDEAFNVALETYQTQPMYREWLEKMFPELSESEDEKIRKEIIAVFKGQTSFTSKENNKKYIAWLEKQDKPSDEEMKAILHTEYEKGRADAIAEMQMEWSEEDEVKINRIVACLENLNVADNDILLKDVDWLKSLRPQNRWKQSDEHIRFLQAMVNDPNNASSESCQIVLKDILEQLKKLKEE